MPTLLPEIFYDLLPYCDNATLCAAAQMSAFVQHLAEALLYSSIMLESPGRCSALITAIDAAPERGPLVHDITLYDIEDKNLLSALLWRLPELKRLTMELRGEMLQPPFPFCLRRLRICHDKMDSWELVTLMDEQPEIEVLELVATVPPRPWPWMRHYAAKKDFRRMVPQLKSLLAPPDAVLAFLSLARPELREIRVQTHSADLAPWSEMPGEIAPGLCAAIEMSAPNLRFLLLGTCDLIGTLRLVAGACSRLDRLELMVHCRQCKDALDKFVAESQADDPQAISSSLLRHFVLHVVGPPFWDPTLDPTDLHASFNRDIVPGLKRILPKLENCEIILYACLDNPSYFVQADYMEDSSTPRLHLA